MLRRTVFIPLGVLLLCLAACQSPDATAARDDAASLQFSGERAFAIETEFVESFPYRDSGQPNNRLAAEWVAAQLIQLEFTCRLDEWDIINFSQPVHLNNVICQLPGKSGREIVLMAHHDQSPATIYGADNDGSGIAIMLHLAELLAAEEKPNYTLTIVSTDAEEFGMIGSQRFVETHPDISNIIAGISLDNLGKALYTGVNMSGIGQFAGNAPLWLLLTARDAAANAGNIWVPEVRAPIDQVLDQAVPISFMDQGPMVAAGIPALGFAGRAPAEAAELHWQTYHTPDDTLEYQSPDTLHHTGRVAEALLRQLMSQDTFPDESGPFLYLAASDRVLRGWPLWLIFITTTALYGLGAAYYGKGSVRQRLAGMRRALPHFVTLWFPWLGGALLLYLLVAAGLMDEYHVYPALAKDPALFNPRWPAVIIFLLGLGTFFYLSWRWWRQRGLPPPTFSQRKSLAMLVIFLVGCYLLFRNPFSLLFLLPLYFWFGIAGHTGSGRIADFLFFLLGGILFYALVYFFGFVILRNNMAVLWYLLMMFSIQEISFITTIMITAALTAGVSLMVQPTRGGKDEQQLA